MKSKEKKKIAKKNPEKNVKKLSYNHTRHNICIMEVQKKTKEMNRRTIGNNSQLEFSQIKVKHQTTDPRSSENTTQDECPHILLKRKLNKTKTKTKENYVWACDIQTAKNQR